MRDANLIAPSCIHTSIQVLHSGITADVLLSTHTHTAAQIIYSHCSASMYTNIAVHVHIHCAICMHKLRSVYIHALRACAYPTPRSMYKHTLRCMQIYCCVHTVAQLDVSTHTVAHVYAHCWHWQDICAAEKEMHLVMGRMATSTRRHCFLTSCLNVTMMGCPF